MGQCGPERLRRGQRLPRRPRRAPLRTRPDGDFRGMGPLGRGRNGHARGHGGQPAAPRSAVPRTAQRHHRAAPRGRPAGRDGDRRRRRLGALPPRLHLLAAERPLRRTGRRTRARTARPAGRPRSLGIRRTPPRPERERPAPAAGRPGARRGGRRPRPHLRRGRERTARLPRGGLRLAHRGRAAQEACHGDRTGPAQHDGVRLPDPHRTGEVPAHTDPRRGRRPRGPGGRTGGRLRRADRHRGHELPLPRRRPLTPAVLGAGVRRRGRHQRLPRQSRLGRHGPVRPGPRTARQDVLHPGRLPARRGRVRRRLLRHLAA